jgi:hypothetical protein
VTIRLSGKRYKKPITLFLQMNIHNSGVGIYGQEPGVLAEMTFRRMQEIVLETRDGMSLFVTRLKLMEKITPQE